MSKRWVSFVITLILFVWSTSWVLVFESWDSFKSVEINIVTDQLTNTKNHIEIMQDTLDLYVNQHLRTLSTDNTLINNVSFDGLYEESLYTVLNETILFIRGDSWIKHISAIFHTLYCDPKYHITKFPLMRYMSVAHLHLFGRNINMTHVNKWLECDKDGTHTTWYHKVTFSNQHHIDPNKNHFEQLSKNNKSQIVITNGYGLWLLHLYPRRHRLYQDNIATLLTYENGTYFEEWFNFTFKTHVKHKNKCLIFTNTGALCFKKHAHAYMAVVDDYLHNKTAYDRYIYECAQSLLSITINESFNATEFCIKYTKLNGIKRLNNLLRQNVNKYQKLGYNVYLFDQYALNEGKCYFTEQFDGGHYPSITIFQVLGLLNVIKNRCGLQNVEASQVFTQSENH
eukprot:287860_1